MRVRSRPLHGALLGLTHPHSGKLLCSLDNLSEVASAVRDDNGRFSLRLKQRKESLTVSRVFADQFRQM